MSSNDSVNIFLSELNKESIFFYRVYESLTTFEEGEHYSHTEDFRTGSLKECRDEAVKYYNERLEGFKSGKVKFHCPFPSYENFKDGENATYTQVF